MTKARKHTFETGLNIGSGWIDFMCSYYYFHGEIEIAETWEINNPQKRNIHETFTLEEIYVLKELCVQDHNE